MGGAVGAMANAEQMHDSAASLQCSIRLGPMHHLNNRLLSPMYLPNSYLLYKECNEIHYERPELLTHPFLSYSGTTTKRNMASGNQRYSEKGAG